MSDKVENHLEVYLLNILLIIRAEQIGSYQLKKSRLVTSDQIVEHFLKLDSQQQIVREHTKMTNSCMTIFKTTSRTYLGL